MENPRSSSIRADALRLGLGFCPEDRKHSGIVADLSVRENIALALQARMGLTKFLALTEQRQIAEKLVAALGVKTASIETPIGQLSGGNQQKAIIARWLATHPRVLILDEPTRGIDIAAKQELMNEILGARARRHGRAVHLRGDRRSGARVGSHHGAARPRQGGRVAARRRRRCGVLADRREPQGMKRLTQTHVVLAGDRTGAAAGGEQSVQSFVPRAHVA